MNTEKQSGTWHSKQRCARTTTMRGLDTGENSSILSSSRSGRTEQEGAWSAEADKVWQVDDKTKMEGMNNNNTFKKNKEFYTNKQNKKCDVNGSKTKMSEKEFSCGRCGTVHGSRCPAYGTECLTCHRIGHFKVCCRTYRTHMLTNNEREKGSEVHFSIDNINTVNNSETW